MKKVASNNRRERATSESLGKGWKGDFKPVNQKGFQQRQGGRLSPNAGGPNAGQQG